ncbi:capsular polysaccharide biosynthesis protein [Allopusillimonas ginsengisoli]|uniref:capsular polysaccharide biosynthesis protein n=1 Tax=Allopusillimonas ginsengisoli TaxID=453575 RepID=UPI001FD6BE99|nr:capsular polysaccharide biosynthesis protein [Allopusillimonas ginsengisoli]
MTAVAGWGMRPSSRQAQALAAKCRLPYLSLEDGFLRAFGTGPRFPPISMVVDGTGIYYDSSRPSDLETLLQSSTDVLEGIDGQVSRAMALIREYRLSKYNDGAADIPWALPKRDSDRRRRVLVVDQTLGDSSIALGAGSAATFASMLQAARQENPGALLCIKTHPEVISGRKKGYFDTILDDDRTLVIRGNVNPLVLLDYVDRVYVVTSQLGFEALMLGKQVSCFGMPWYGGWGVTDDRQLYQRRTRQRSVRALFAAAYIHYTRYLDPVTGRRGTVFDAIEWLIRQRSAASQQAGRRLICVGFRRWKACQLAPMLSFATGGVAFAPNAARAAALMPSANDDIAYWGLQAPAGVEALAKRTGASTIRVEDGFVRSVGLGSDFVRPLSLVLDQSGIYFDPCRESDLELILNEAVFSSAELARAKRVREFIVAHGLSKYNTGRRDPVRWNTQGRVVILVPGQVENDASVSAGCDEINTNLALLQAVRRSHPDAWIVYKPHPDVMAGNRPGKISMSAAGSYADHIERDRSVVACIEACDAVHTMTSLSGFDALLRGKQVTVYGRAFYAGWGLTDDKIAIARRRKVLSIDALVAGVLLRYPLYWDWELQGVTSCEAVLHRIVATRMAVERSGRLWLWPISVVHRQLGKLHVLMRGILFR